MEQFPAAKTVDQHAIIPVDVHLGVRLIDDHPLWIWDVSLARLPKSISDQKRNKKKQNRKSLVGKASRQMLARYRHVRMEAKRKALETIVSKPAPAPQAAQPTYQPLATFLAQLFVRRFTRSYPTGFDKAVSRMTRAVVPPNLGNATSEAKWAMRTIGSIPEHFTRTLRNPRKTTKPFIDNAEAITKDIIVTASREGTISCTTVPISSPELVRWINLRNRPPRLLFD
jgi:hypothetical protein